MKRNLLYLFTILCVFSFFTACSSDDDDVDWTTISKEYKGDDSKLTLEVNKKKVTEKGKSATVDATSAEAASITLNNILPDTKAIKVDGKLDGLTFTGETTVNGNCAVSVTGQFDTKGNLNLSITKNLTSAVTGSFKLNFVSGNPIYWNTDAKSDHPLVSQIISGLPEILSPLMSAKVSSVDIKLLSDGSFDFDWTQQGESSPTEKSPILTGILTILNIQCAVVGDELRIAVDESVKELIDQFLPTITAGNSNFDPAMVEAAFKMMTHEGGFYYLPIKFKQNGEVVTFYLNTATSLPLLKALEPMLPGLLPENMEGIDEIVKETLKSLSSAKLLEVGLVFNKWQMDY